MKKLLLILFCVIVSQVSLQAQSAADQNVIKDDIRWLQTKLKESAKDVGYENFQFMNIEQNVCQIQYTYSVNEDDTMKTYDYIFYLDDLDTTRMYNGYRDLTVLTENEKLIIDLKTSISGLSKKGKPLEKVETMTREKVVPMYFNNELVAEKARYTFVELIKSCKSMHEAEAAEYGEERRKAMARYPSTATSIVPKNQARARTPVYSRSDSSSYDQP